MIPIADRCNGSRQLYPANANTVGATSLAQAYINNSGRVQDVTAAAVWTSSDPTVASIDHGRVTAIAPGTVEITVSYNGLSDRYGFSVEPRQR